MFTGMEDSGPEIGSLDIESLEHKLKVVFPESYKNFLIKFNGGEPIERAINFNTSEKKQKGDYIDFFYEVSNDVSYGIYKNMENHGFKLPEKIIFIGSSPAGNYFLLSLREDSYGNIYYKNHEVEDSTVFSPQNDRLPESMLKVAEDFDSFLSYLYDPDE